MLFLRATTAAARLYSRTDRRCAENLKIFAEIIPSRTDSRKR